MRILPVVLLLACAGAAAAATAPAVLSGTITADAEQFGASVDVHGSTLVVGVPNADVGASPYQGRVYVYELTGGAWILQTELTAPDGTDYDQFGYDVAVSGDVIVAGSEEAPVGPHSSRGAAYVFHRNAGGPGVWGMVKKLVAPEAVGNIAEYGHSVAADGDLIVVGAPKAYSAGRVFVYARDAGGADNWGELADMGIDISDTNAEVGYAVAVQGDVVVAGALRRDANPGQYDNTGAVYVYQRDAGGTDAFGQVARVQPQDAPLYNMLFGSAVSLDAGRLVVGAFGYSAPGSGWGKTYVYDMGAGPDAWTEVAAFQPADGNDYMYSGHAVASLAGNVYTGAGGHDGERGKAYRLQDDAVALAWGEAEAYTASDGAPGDFFAHDVAAQGEWIVIGANQADGGQGAVYVFPAPTVTSAVAAAPAAGVRLLGNHPNPFNPSTEIRFALDRAGPVRLSVHDLRGRAVEVLVDGELSAGDHAVTWAPRDLPSGTYAYRVTAGGAAATGTLLLAK